MLPRIFVRSPLNCLDNLILHAVFFKSWIVVFLLNNIGPKI
jgi:hypothetical protein